MFAKQEHARRRTPLPCRLMTRRDEGVPLSPSLSCSAIYRTAAAPCRTGSRFQPLWSGGMAQLSGATYCLRAPRITRLAILFVGLMTLAGTRLATVAHSAVDITIDNLTFAPTTIGEPG